MIDFDTVLVALVSAAAPTILGIIGIWGANSRLSKQLKSQQVRIERTADIQSRRDAQQYFRENFEVFKRLFASASGLQIVREWLAMMTPETLGKQGDLLLSTQKRWEEALENFVKEPKTLRDSGWTLLLPRKVDAVIYEVEVMCVGARFLHWATKDKPFDPNSIMAFLGLTKEIGKKLDELRDHAHEIWGVEML